MDIDRATINRLVAEALELTDPSKIYLYAVDFAKNIRFEGSTNKEKLEKWGIALGGFACGIDFALTYLDKAEEGETSK